MIPTEGIRVIMTGGFQIEAVPAPADVAAILNDMEKRIWTRDSNAVLTFSCTVTGARFALKWNDVMGVFSFRVQPVPPQPQPQSYGQQYLSGPGNLPPWPQR